MAGKKMKVYAIGRGNKLEDTGETADAGDFRPVGRAADSAARSEERRENAHAKAEATAMKKLERGYGAKRKTR